MNQEIVIKDYSKLYNEQFNLIRQFICHYISYKEIYSRKKELMSADMFWAQTNNAHIHQAVIIWCKIFGAFSNKTHWREITQNQSERKEFVDILLEKLNINKEQWDTYGKKMRDLRDKCIAHTDLEDDIYSIIVPQLDVAVEAVKIYDEWARNKIYGADIEQVALKMEDIVEDYTEQTQMVLKMYIDNDMNTPQEKY